MAYLGFEKLKAKVAAGGARNPGAVAATIGRKKYGKEKFQKAAAKGEKLEGEEPEKRSKKKGKKGAIAGMLRGKFGR